MNPPASTPVPELLARARGGEAGAREQLYRMVAPGVRALSRRLAGSRAQADDLFQDSMVVMLERLGEFRGEAPFGIWLRRICITRYLMQRRSPWHRSRVPLTGDEESRLVAAGDPGENLDLELALHRLAPTARTVVWLFEVEGYTHQEIASRFGRSVSFSKSQLARAHRSLRAWLGAAAALVLVMSLWLSRESTAPPVTPPLAKASQAEGWSSEGARAPLRYAARSVEFQPSITRAGAGLVTADLEDRIALVDETLTAARGSDAHSVRVSFLQQHRAELVASLDQMRRAEQLAGGLN